MNSLDKIYARARKQTRKIVLPEATDKRVVEAAKIITKEKIADVVLLEQKNIDPALKEKYSQAYYELRKIRGISLDDARKVLDDPLFYGAMMAREGLVDGFVAGAAHTTADVARAAMQCIGLDDVSGIISSCFLMMVPDCPFGDEGTLVYADCGIIPEPNPSQVARIAICTADLAWKVLGIAPRVALLSFSTKGSAKGQMIDNTREALRLAKEMRPDLLIDGELQADAAIVPEVAQIKCPDSPIKGRANVLIFPDLEAGNICYKLTQRLAKATAIGPLITGLKKPCSDLSRGCGVDEVVNAVAVTAIRAQSA